MAKKFRTTLYIDTKLWEELKKDAEEKGLSINQVCVSSISEYIREKKLHHYNVYENHVTIWDGNIGKLVDVYLVKQTNSTVMLSCSEDLNSTCEHCQFTKKIGKVQDMLDKEGLKFKD